MVSRPPLGVSLADILGATSSTPHMSKGQIIAGIIGDALAGAAGRSPVVGPMIAQEREQQAQEAQWGKHLLAQRMIEQAIPDASPMERDARAWAQMSPQERQAYLEMNKAKEGDPIVTITLPNNQIYSGPRSGLADALTGGSASQPPANRPPIGAVVPDPRMNGGQASPAPGGFPNGPYPNVGPYKRY
jgi:hypothetical protein